MQDIHPIKPPIDIPLLTQTQKTILFVIIGVILILLAWKIWNWLHKKYLLPKEKPTPAPPPPNYEHETLQQLKQAYQLIENNQLNLFYLTITEIMRKYLSQKHKINAQDMTTTEISQSSDLRKALGPKNYNFFVQFFKQTDIIKFTDIKKDKKNAEKAYHEVYSYFKTNHYQ